MSSLQLQLDYGGWISSYVTGKSIVCLPSLPKKLLTTVEIPQNNFFQFGDALEWQHYLLEYIFQFLETKDLQSASLVNPFWKNLAKRELQKRISPTWINFSYQTIHRQSLHLETSFGFTQGHTALGLFLYCPDMIRLEQYVWLDKTYNASFAKMTSFAEYIGKEILPSGVDYCTISCSDIISTDENRMTTVIYRGMLIPFIPKIRTAMFHCDPQTPQPVTNYINANEQVKCVLMFSQHQTTFPESFFSSLFMKQSPKAVALGGGLIKSTKIFKNKNNSKKKSSHTEKLFCITFLQEIGTEANFNAYSVVFNHAMYPSQHRCEAFENELLKLKQTSVLRKHGIIFKFCYFINALKRETLLTEKYFPKYPLLGFGLDIDWVVGWNTINTLEKSEKGSNFEDSSISKRLKTSIPKCTHSQSTVFVLVTWGKKV